MRIHCAAPPRSALSSRALSSVREPRTLASHEERRFSGRVPARRRQILPSRHLAARRLTRGPRAALLGSLSSPHDKVGMSAGPTLIYKTCRSILVRSKTLCTRLYRAGERKTGRKQVRRCVSPSRPLLEPCIFFVIWLAGATNGTGSPPSPWKSSRRPSLRVFSSSAPTCPSVVSLSFVESPFTGRARRLRQCHVVGVL